MAGWHRDHTAHPGDVTNVLAISTNVQNTELTAVGNFTSVNGQTRSQIASFDISGASSYALSPWFTNQFTQACQSNFETYVTDVEYAPNGNFFVVSTAGAFGGSTGSLAGTSGCDVVARFETGGNSGPTPASWTAYTGGDSTWTVEVTDNVVYVGGHQKFQNNPSGPANEAGGGAVSRPGIAALNTVNGIPFSWNPTRTRGVGVQDMLATPQGLYVGSDTDRIGAYEYHARIAMLPLAGGDVLPPMANATLPGTVYSVAPGGSQLVRRSFDGTTGSSPANAPNGTAPWSSSVGAFMVNGVLYTATNGGVLTKRTFDGTTYGTASTVDTGDGLVFQTTWHNTDVPSITSLFYVDGRMYFTRSGQTTLFRRGFETESDLVGQQRFAINPVSGINYSTMRGAFVASGRLYFADTTGRLFRATWGGNGPVAGSATQISGPGIDSQTWNARAMFIYQAAGQQTNPPPIPVADVNCTGLTCSYDSTDSSDPGGSIASVLWQFGDGVNSTSTAPVTSHTYAASGPRTVTLTVTDNGGASRSTTVSINPQAPAGNSPPTAVANVSCTLLHCNFTSTGSDDSDGDITGYLWNFGDGDTSTDPNPSHDFAPPGGPQHVTLTVTDNDDATGTATRDFSVSETASPVTFVGRQSHQRQPHAPHVAVPSNTQVGDRMVLFFAANTTSPTYTYPAGWTAVGGTVTGSGFVGRAFTRTATAADLGTSVRVTSSAYAKSDMALSVYRGATGIAANAGALHAGAASTAHTSPVVNAPAGSKWLVTYWADKTSSTTAWTPPAGQSFRSSAFGTSGGHMSGLLVDSGADVSGSTGGLTATANSSSSTALSFSIVLQ